MHDLFHRLAIGLLLLAGLATLADAAAAGLNPSTLWLQHRQVLVALIGAALALAPWWPALRLPAISAALLSKVSLLALALPAAPAMPAPLAAEALQVLMLAAAGAILVHEARLEARWNTGWREG